MTSGVRATVLVVDGDDDVRVAHVALIATQGYPVAEAENGATALEWLRTHEPPGLLLIDLMMPVMNGLRFREEQLKDPRISGVPAVAITARGPALERLEPLRFAAVLYKPVDVAVLFETLARHCLAGGGEEVAHAPTVLERLRSETRDQHLAIEAVVPLSRPGLTRQRYVAYLEALLGFYTPLEERLGRLSCWSALGFDHGARRKLPLLTQDLAALGGRDEVTLCTTLPALETAAQALGCLYVIEGSTLGGRTLVRRVRETLGSSTGTAFLDAYGDQTGPRWRAMKDTIVSFAASSGCEDEVVASARSTFAALTGWLAAHQAV